MTYRLQLGPALRFEVVGALAPYLATLGAGSSHGDDVIGHSAWLSLGSDVLAGRFRDRLTGGVLETERRGGAPTLPSAALFASFPVALPEPEAP